MKKLLLIVGLIAFLAIPVASFGAMGTMNPKSKDVDIVFFGSMKTYPTFMSTLDFNDDSRTANDWVLDENGYMDGHNIRNELRIGWKGKGKNWDFLIILEGDFNLDKNNTDRGADASSPLDSGMTGEDFGIEKLNLTYNFGPFAVEAGWNTKFLDIMTGGLVYGDDHPYVGLTGKVGKNFTWEALYLSIYDATDGLSHGASIGPTDATSLDWRVYSVKGIFKLDNGFAISPFYAYSDNNDGSTQNAKVSYLGVEAYGKLGIITPRFEFAYATGSTDKNAAGKDYDISSWAAYGSVDINLSKECVPYFGVRWEQGDDDPNDDDIDAFNSITDIARYTPTFGIESGFVYKMVPALGTHLYSGNFAYLPKLLGATTPGYGGIGNSSSGDAPGLVMIGGGVKGTLGKLFYKAQIMYFAFEEEEGLEKIVGHSVDTEVGQEYDVLLTYNFSKHFSVGNCLSVFDPGDAIQDLWGNDYDSTAFMNTIELKWRW